MSSLLTAIKDDYHDYVIFCKTKEIEPVNLYSNKSFYETKEWKEIEKIPHISGCLASALKKEESEISS